MWSDCLSLVFWVKFTNSLVQFCGILACKIPVCEFHVSILFRVQTWISGPQLRSRILDLSSDQEFWISIQITNSDSQSRSGILRLNPSKSPDARSATSGWLNLWISFLQFWVNLALKVESRLSQFGPGRNLQILPFYFCPFSPSHHLFLCPALILNSLVRFLFLILHSLSPISPCPFLCPFWPCLFHVCKCTICQSS